MRLTIALLLLAGAPLVAQEDEPLIGDRPDFTESAFTIAPGRLQLEAGATHSEAGDTENLELGELLLRVGVARRLEVRIGLNSYARDRAPGVEDSTGFVDSSLGAKVALGETAGWATAILFNATLPTGSSGSRETHPQPEVILLAQRDLTEILSVGTNLGYGYPSSEGERFSEIFGSLSLGVSLGKTVGAFFEVFGFVPTGTGGPETYFFDSGLTKTLGANLQLDIRLGAGLNSAADDLFAGAGLIWRH